MAKQRVSKSIPPSNAKIRLSKKDRRIIRPYLARWRAKDRKAFLNSEDGMRCIQRLHRE